MRIDLEACVEDALGIPKIMATHSHRKAFSYLAFTVFMLLSSMVTVGLFWSGLPDGPGSQLVRSDARLNLFAGVLFVLGLLIASLVSLAIACRNYLLAHRLDKNGRLADGIITDKWEDTFDGRVLYYISYRVQEDMEAWESISRRLYAKLDKGCNVPILYLQQDTSVLRLDCERISI